jgi:phosphoribosylamine--glycine ligase
MKALLIGSGGREHALALALLDSESVTEVVVCPGNGGTVRAPEGLEGSKILRNSAETPVAAARALGADLVVVGPEAPLCAGLGDELRAAGFSTFGPSRAAAALEGSKAFMKDFALRHGLPTARAVVVQSVEELDRALGSFDVAPVVKADGLCAGKGVVVASTHVEARAAALGMLDGSAFGVAGQTLVLEERLLGAEASVHAISDGSRILVLPVAQDHKRLLDGDAGPNTGGMGTYAPAPLVTPALAERIRREILEPAVANMASDGTPFVGALFAGLMIDSGEPRLLEFNVRFGDPETQVLLPLVDGDFAELLLSAAVGKLSPDTVQVSERHAVCVVLASQDYPAGGAPSVPISGVSEAERVPGVTVIHAGTRMSEGQLLTSGGRVLGIRAVGSSLRQAQERAYQAAALVEFRGKQMRRDIAARALGSA